MNEEEIQLIVTHNYTYVEKVLIDYKKGEIGIKEATYCILGKYELGIMEALHKEFKKKNN